MGCAHSAEMVLFYPSALNDVDAEVLAIWNTFLRGESPAWRDLVASGQNDRKTPAVYWSDDFKNRLVRNLATTHPCIAMELASRPIKNMARILCGIMQVCLINVIQTHVTHKGEVTKVEADQRAELLAKIARHHCKWGVSDADYILVETAMMESLRACLGFCFKPQFEVRVRYKYALIKKAVQDAEEEFKKNHKDEATKLRQEGVIRLRQLKGKFGKEGVEGGRRVLEPFVKSLQYTRMLTFSVHNSVVGNDDFFEQS